ncbi:MAG: hypothetical protein HY055_05235 [Magnetospirillum sp.]|nr:hypothetical protein [Magnetospirillum sp.]
MTAPLIAHRTTSSPQQWLIWDHFTPVQYQYPAIAARLRPTPDGSILCISVLIYLFACADTGSDLVRAGVQ